MDKLSDKFTGGGGGGGGKHTVQFSHYKRSDMSCKHLHTGGEINSLFGQPQLLLLLWIYVERNPSDSHHNEARIYSLSK